MGIVEKPLVGWRRYGVSIPGLLTSNDAVIVPRERSTSYCRGKSHYSYELGKVVLDHRCQGAPEAHCTCGFYAFNSFEKFMESDYLSEGVIAEVAMWGTVHVYKEGFRAEHTYPMRLFTWGDLAERCRFRLGQEYLVPVKRFDVEFAEELALAQQARAAKRAAWGNQRTLSDKELYQRLLMGDDDATRKLRKRLASAICTRKKSLVRMEKNLEAARVALAEKIALREQVNADVAKRRGR